MDVDTDNPPGGQSEYQGTTYYFCAPGCKVAFDKEPDKYLSEAHDHDHDDHEGHDHGSHDKHEGHDHGSHDDHEAHEEEAEESHDDHGDHGDEGHSHGPGGHSHGGHHMPESASEAAAPTGKKPGFFSRLFGKK
jgi:YHS domain-containing protein